MGCPEGASLGSASLRLLRSTPLVNHPSPPSPITIELVRAWPSAHPLCVYARVRADVRLTAKALPCSEGEALSSVHSCRTTNASDLKHLQPRNNTNQPTLLTCLLSRFRGLHNDCGTHQCQSGGHIQSHALVAASAERDGSNVMSKSRDAPPVSSAVRAASI